MTNPYLETIHKVVRVAGPWATILTAGLCVYLGWKTNQTDIELENLKTENASVQKQLDSCRASQKPSARMPEISDSPYKWRNGTYMYDAPAPK